MLRRRRVAIASANRTAEFDIPGYRGELVGTFKALDFDTLRKLGQQVDRSRHPRKQQHGMADLLAWSCVGMSMKVDGELRPLDVLGQPDLT